MTIHTIRSHVIRRLATRRVAALTALVLCVFFATGMINTSLAADLGSAKAQGLVGEKRDGYLGLVDPNAPADVKQLVKNINDKRRANYEAIAKKNKVSVDQVGKLTAEKVINKAAKGTFVQGPGGGWQKR